MRIRTHVEKYHLHTMAQKRANPHSEAIKLGDPRQLIFLIVVQCND